MKVYDSTNEECMHHDAFPTKNTYECDIPNRNPRKLESSGSGSRIKWILIDALLLFCLCGVCTWYFYAESNASSIIGSSSRLDSAHKQLIDEEIELLWTKQHVAELEEEVEQVSDRDNVYKKMRLEAKEVTDLELQYANEENKKLKMELARAHEARLERKETHNVRSGAKRGFLKGDLVEFYDPKYHNINSKGLSHLFAPHVVDSSNLQGSVTVYDVFCAIDGTKKQFPDKYLRKYEPYAKGTEAMCNMGTFEVSRFFPCTVLDYLPGTMYLPSGAAMLQQKYQVRIGPHQMRSDDTYDLPTDTVPLWKVERIFVSSSDDDAI